jgi:hypothetical protein
MGEVIWLHEHKPKALLQSGPLLTLREGQPMRLKESKGEVIFTCICVLVLQACAGYFTFAFTQTPLP